MTKEELEGLLAVLKAGQIQVTQTFNYNAPVGQQIGHVDKIEAHFDKDMGMQVVGAAAVQPAVEIKPKPMVSLPPVLKTPRALELWEMAREGNLVDDDYMPLGIQEDAALLADRFCELLKIKTKQKWSIFAKFWGMKNLRQRYSDALSSKDYISKIKDIQKLIR